MRVIGPQGEQLGILRLADALARAESDELDLVEVSPMARPPVCKIMNYDRFRYEASRPTHRPCGLRYVQKEIRLRPQTEPHDLAVKLRQARAFLEAGLRLKLTIRFRGRELSHREVGVAQLQATIAQLAEVAIIAQPPRQEGATLFVLLSPAKWPVTRPANGDEK